jgi:hypothetical protein
VHHRHRCDDTALYFGCVQSDTCTLANHKKDFDAAVIAMVASGGQQPNAERLAARFILSLDPKRYAQLKVDLENQTRSGLNVLPKTLPDAFHMAFNYKKVGHAAQTVDASVFVASG